MSGSILGGKKTAVTLKAKYGQGYYVLLGKMPHARGGFKGRSDLARIAGKKGGLASHRTWSPEQRKAQSIKRREANIKAHDDMWPEIFSFHVEPPKKPWWRFW